MKKNKFIALYVVNYVSTAASNREGNITPIKLDIKRATKSGINQAKIAWKVLGKKVEK